MHAKKIVLIILFGFLSLISRDAQAGNFFTRLERQQSDHSVFQNLSVEGLLVVVEDGDGEFQIWRPNFAMADEYCRSTGWRLMGCNPTNRQVLQLEEPVWCAWSKDLDDAGSWNPDDEEAIHYAYENHYSKQAVICVPY